ncbi:MAG: conjugal transfer protein TraH [Alphaproteobacteria bacterium]|nr:conjugal transfer protein TraH [Alphaproteobacteria bacterium]
MKKILVCLLLSTCPLYAGMQDNLEKAFGVLGMSNNVTTAGGYQDQTGGFYTGGSVFGRSKVNNAELFSLQMPHYRAGCGGIDLFMGGFSFINAQAFTQLLRNIGSNAGGYAFNLALATVTPQIKSVLDDLSAKVQAMTNQNINSCEAAATLVGGAWPQSNASSQLLCNAMSKDLGLATDWAQSHQKCGAEQQMNATLDRKAQTQDFKDVLGDEFNIAWKAIQKNAFLSQDVQLAEFFMTISGTIVSRRVNERVEAIVLPSKSGDSTLLSALIQGLIPIEIYKCDDTNADKCLSPTFQTITLPEAKALHGKVQSLLQSISQKVRVDGALSVEERGFVNSTMIPVLKIIAVEVAFREGGSPLSITNFSEAIAHDILLQYLDEVMSIVWDSVTQLQKVQISDAKIEELRAGIAGSRKLLFAQRTALFEQMSTTLDAIERTQAIERKLQNMFISSQQGTVK